MAVPQPLNKSGFTAAKCQWPPTATVRLRLRPCCRCFVTEQTTSHVFIRGSNERWRLSVLTETTELLQHRDRDGFYVGVREQQGCKGA